MGLSANRNPGMAPMQTAPVAEKVPFPGAQVQKPEFPISPAPQAFAAPQAQSPPFTGQYPYLNQFAQHGPFGGIFARILMQGMENRRLAAGMSPEDWQARINANRAAYRQRLGF